MQAVAAHAAAVSHDLALDEVLVAAAWLHDIGYVPGLVDTGFHPLDGARFLRRSGVCEQVAALVAYHSCAEIEADVRGLARVIWRQSSLARRTSCSRTLCATAT